MQHFMATVIYNAKLQDGVYDIKLAADTAGVMPKPGQFYLLMPKTELLGRPLCICEAGDGWLEFCYAVVGRGTREFSQYREGDELALTGPLGGGFDVDYINTRKRAAIVSGSAGIAPFVELVKHLTCEVECFCGFGDKSFMTERLRNVKIATESGVEGHKGFITELIDPREFDIVLACGPEGLSKEIAKMCAESGTKLLISLDGRMACGIGACLCCTCKTKSGYKRVCADGSVFEGSEIVWE